MPVLLRRSTGCSEPSLVKSFNVLGQTESLGEYSVLWHVPVAAEQVPAVTSFLKHISITESQEEGFKFDKDWITPLKRLRGMRDGLPQEERDSAAWLGDALMAS